MARLIIDELEMLNPDELGRLLRFEAVKLHPDISSIEDLITVGCPIDHRDEYGHTALHRAANGNKLEVVKILISKGADIHARTHAGETPLNYAADSCDPDMIEFLISMGGDVHSINKFGWTALWYAIEGGNLEVVKYLLSIGIEFITNDMVPEVESYLDLKNGWNRDVINYMISRESYE